MQNLNLADAVHQLRQELIKAIDKGRNEAIRFAIDPIELELEVELMTGGETKADCKWVVVSFGGGVKGESRSSHRVKLTLKPVDVKKDKNSGNTERVLVHNTGKQKKRPM